MKNEKYGAVCYIDLLGFSYLTNYLESEEPFLDNKKEIPFIEKQVKNLTLSELPLLIEIARGKGAMPDDDSEKISLAEWSYEIVNNNLKTFHKVVKDCCSKYKSIQHVSISDSLFIVSESSDDLLIALANIFRNCIKNGILLRAGLSYGSYYMVTTDISTFNIFGTAVTKAVNYEKYGKGCRIFTDAEFPKTCSFFNEKNSKLFAEYKNYYNYSIFNCFEWLMIKDEYVLELSDINNLYTSERFKKVFDVLSDNLEILCNLCFSESFNWNLKNSSGTEQLGASIEYVSQLIDKIYSFTGEKRTYFYENISNGIEYTKNDNRSKEILNKMINRKKAELKKVFFK